MRAATILVIVVPAYLAACRGNADPRAGAPSPASAASLGVPGTQSSIIEPKATTVASVEPPS